MKIKFYYRVIVEREATDFVDFVTAKDYYYNARHKGLQAQFICL